MGHLILDEDKVTWKLSSWAASAETWAAAAGEGRGWGYKPTWWTTAR